MICYTDADGHTYDFGFGMNWKGEIHDARTEKYVNIVAKPEIHLKGNMVTLSCSTPGTKIYYTTNGVTPAFVAENEFTKPFTVKKGSTIKAIAKKYGVDNSSLVELVQH
jgi:beta-glucosidase